MRACLQLCQLFATPWTVAHQAPMSMGFSRQECCSGLLFPPQGDLPSWGLKQCLLCLLGRQADSLPLSQLRSPPNGMEEKMLVAQSIQLFATLWTIAQQAPLSIEFSR